MRGFTRWLRAKPDRLALLSAVLVTVNVFALFLMPRALALTLQGMSVGAFLLVLLLVFGAGRRQS